MLHALMKAVWYLMQPSSLLALAAIVAFMLATRGHIRRARQVAFGLLTFVALFGIGPCADLLIMPLESRFPRPVLEPSSRIAGLILLGGSEDPSAARPGKPVVMAVNEGGERVMEAASLARQFPAARLVISGGSGNILATRTPEAEITADMLEALGVARERMTLEGQSRTTHENAKLTQQMIGDPTKGGGRWLLVTTAWHMPRAIGTFRAAGLELEPWPVDYRTRGRFEPLRVHSNVFEGIRRLDYAVKEWVGLIGYRLTGRSSAFFPSIAEPKPPA